jgi:hypothetical protein
LAGLSLPPYDKLDKTANAGKIGLQLEKSLDKIDKMVNMANIASALTCKLVRCESIYKDLSCTVWKREF